MIRLVDVAKAFDTRPAPTYVLRRINLELRQRDFVTIMGPAGGGKSSALPAALPQGGSTACPRGNSA